MKRKTYYKAVRLDRTSHYDGKTLWRVGKVVRPTFCDPDTEVACGDGIHCSAQLLDAVKYQRGPSRYYEVEPTRIICDSGDKVRCEAVKVLRELRRAEIDKLAGFSLWEANHPIHPLKVTHEEMTDAELLELVADWASVWTSVRASVRASVWDSMGVNVGASMGASMGGVYGAAWASIWCSVGDSVWRSMEGRAKGSVEAYYGSLFPITQWEYIDRPDPWASLRKLWVSGYVPSYDGAHWRLHVGPDAEVYREWTADKVRGTGEAKA